MSTSPFSDELRVFQEHRHDWLRVNADKFVVIQGSNVAEGFFDTYSEALRAGLQRFGGGRNFLVKQVSKTESIYFIS